MRQTKRPDKIEANKVVLAEITMAMDMEVNVRSRRHSNKVWTNCGGERSAQAENNAEALKVAISSNRLRARSR